MSNATSNFSSSLSEDPGSHRTNFPRTSLVIILGVLSFGTVVGNSIVCFAIRSQPALRHVTYLSSDSRPSGRVRSNAKLHFEKV